MDNLQNNQKSDENPMGYDTMLATVAQEFIDWRDKLHSEMRNRNGQTIADASKKSIHRMMAIYETERMRSYNWGAYNGLADAGESTYDVYDTTKMTIIDNRKISESKYYDLPPDHPNSKVIIRKANEKK